MQHERAPRSCMMSQSHLNGLSAPDMYTSNRIPSFNGPCNFFHFPPQHSLSSPLLPKLSSLPNMRYSIPSMPLNFGFGGNHSSSSALYLDCLSNKMSSILKDDDVVTSSEVSSTVPNAVIPLQKEAIYESAAKILFLAVNWARSLPSFNQLPLRDQTLLLEDSWAELFVLTASQWGLNLDALPSEKSVKYLQNAINKFLLLRIDQTEVACLKALVLFKPDCYNLSSISQILSLQDQTLNLLFEKCGAIRFGHILMTLPAIKLAAYPQGLQEVLFKGTIGEVAIERILGDLINNIK